MTATIYLPRGRATGMRASGLPVSFFDHFLSGGVTISDAALANESDPYGHFGTGFGTYIVFADTTDTGFLPRIKAGGDGGHVEMSTDATSGERIGFQLYGLSFAVASKRRLYFETKLKTTNVTADMFVGLAYTSTDPHADAPQDYIAFGLTGDADIEIGCGLADSDAGAFSGTDSTVDIVADAFTTLAFEYDGATTVAFYVDGALAGTIADATVPVGTVLSPIFCIESNGAAETLTVDYVAIEVDAG